MVFFPVKGFVAQEIARKALKKIKSLFSCKWFKIN